MKRIPRPDLRTRLTENTRRFLQDPPAYFVHMRETYGDIFEMGLLRPGVFGITHPDYVRHVLVGNQKNYIKDRPTRTLKLSLGNGLLTSEGEFWRRQRRIAQPAFHRQRLAGMVEAMTRQTEAMLERWESLEGPFDLAQEMMVLTSRIVTETLFGADLKNPDQIGKAIHHNNRFLTRYFRSLFNWPLWVPTKANRQFNRMQKQLDQTIYFLIEQRRKKPEGQNDLLSMLMEARDEETGEGMTDQQLRDEVATLFAAGHETSANALSWIFFLLGQNPGILQKLRVEVGSVLEGRKPALVDLAALPYVKQVIQESMRLFPPAWVIGREPLTEDQLGEYRLPKRATLVIPTWVIHRHPEFWPEPEKFDPDRFLPEKVKARDKFCYLPFGGGPRICIGINFAMMEMQLVLPMILQKYTLRLAENQRIEKEPLITLRPKNGILVEKEANSQLISLP